MSNLGKYQEFTTEAAKRGGVDSYIQDIERGAVLKAAPVILIAGAIVGWWSRRIAEKARAAEAALEAKTIQIEIGDTNDE